MDPDLVEKLKRLVIIALFSNDDLMQTLVLKGGNLLDVVHGISTRPSKDVDLSMCGQFDDLEKARQAIEQALKGTLDEHGYLVFDVKLREAPPPEWLTDDLKDFWGGYKADFKLIPKEQQKALGDNLDDMRRRAVIVRDGGSTKFPIEISRNEYCEEKEAVLLDGYTIYAYTPAMLICEKLRAICQQMPEYRAIVKGTPRSRGRDFLDIHNVAERFPLDFAEPRFRDTLRKVFAAKRVDVNLLRLVESPEVKEFHRADFETIRDTVRPGEEVQSYDFYHSYVVQKIHLLEPLWDE